VDVLHAAMRALDACLVRGLPIAGYFHWSLVDNYEWGSFAPRFGLHAVDHDDGARRLPHDATGADAAGAYRELVRARRG
jgi:beta-glucosidase/6-phospho-beta-glucosidase/beta-galactosidase